MEADDPREIFKPIVKGWLERIARAVQAKQPWQDVADQCMQFFAGATGFMWEEKFRKKFIKGNISPKFRVSLHKAFELVALYGPVLYHRNPTRTVRPYTPINFEPEIVAAAMGFPPDLMDELQQASQEFQSAQQQGAPVTPEIQQKALMFETASQQVQQVLRADNFDKMRIRVTCQMMERYLNYTPLEQPDGGLEQAGEDGVTEMLIKGRGVLFARPYTMPGSQRVLTGCFHESADDLVNDPDAKTWNFGDNRWIALRHANFRDELERMFQLPPGSMKNGAKFESGQAQADRQSHEHGNLEKERGNTKDLVIWWELWSTCGIARRIPGMSQEAVSQFDALTGDYGYLCLAEGIPWPLNANPEKLRSATEDEARRLFSWPIPFHADSRWPCAVLDAYREPNCAWPIAPMKPGIGELSIINVLLSALVNHAYQSSKTIVATLTEAKGYVEKALKSGDDLIVIEIPRILEDINKCIQEFQYKPIALDLYKVIDSFLTLFDKRVGLSDLIYGMQGPVASRSATDVKVREERLSVRPDHMAKKVDSWMSEAARMEKIAAYFGRVDGQSVRPLLGSLGARLWDTYFVQADPETILREMEATVEAGTAQKRNRERDISNLSQLTPTLLPVLDKHADVTGDTGPVNAFFDKLGQALDQDMTGLSMTPRTPQTPPQPPDTGEQEQARAQADADAAQVKVEAARQESAIRIQEAKQKMRMKQEEHKQKLDIAKTMARMKRLQGTKAK